MSSVSKLILFASVVLLHTQVHAQTARNNIPDSLLDLGKAIQQPFDIKNCKDGTDPLSGFQTFTCIGASSRIDSLQIVRQVPLDSAYLSYVRGVANIGEAKKIADQAKKWATENGAKITDCDPDSTESAVIHTTLLILPGISGMIYDMDFSNDGRKVMVLAIQPPRQSFEALCLGRKPSSFPTPVKKRGYLSSSRNR